jgi:uracil-DNA glycosylase
MNKIDININKIRKKFKDSLNSSGWNHIMDPIIDSNEFEIAIYKLKAYVENDQRFTPKLSEIFNAFIHCPYNDLKVIIIGQDPYPQLGVADGISFSCSKTKKLQPSLRYIFKEINGSQYDSLDPDLTRWSKQGVLMLNTAFTVEIGKIGSHYNVWKPITKMILEAINNDLDGIAVALLGKKAEEWHLKLNNQKIFKAPHPASAAYKGGKWDSKNIFNNINMHLYDLKLKSINW